MSDQDFPDGIEDTSPGEEAFGQWPDDQPDEEPGGQPSEEDIAVAEAAKAEEIPEVEPLPEFDEKMREDFNGLMFIGKLTRDFTWMGHDFTIKTLSTNELLEVGLVHRKYMGTMGETKAYQAAVVASCIVSVDGKEPPLPMTNEKEDNLLGVRFRYMTNNWFPPTIDAIYEESVILEKRSYDVIQAMGKAFG